MKHYFPMNMMESHDTLLEESAFSRFTRMRISVPVPFVNSREALIHGRGYDMTERSAMCISFKSLPDDFTHPGFTVPPCGKGYTRIDVSGAYYLEIQPDGSVVFLQLQMMDIKMKMLPRCVPAWPRSAPALTRTDLASSLFCLSLPSCAASC